MASSPSSSSSSLSSSVKVKDVIELTDKENQIFSRLLQVVHHFNLHTQLRVAGGWVRDKLLGKDCHDIDIALDNIMGKEFCEKINEYLSVSGEETQGIGVVQCNPDQSKHLETATMRMFGESIDFVNLRSETYSENSRIPTMEFGSAKQDAYRRDLTINSLFYNINKKSVEDFTERGLADLKSGKIVTPLPPKETFLDDPLRVLRAIRFGARFSFVLDEELKEAAASDEVGAAILDKISRERVGREIDLMILDKQPVQAVTYICSLQLFWVVFTLPATTEPAVSEGCDRLCVASMDAAWNLLELIGYTALNDEQRRLYLYSSFFTPLRKVLYSDNKGKKIPVANYIFRNSLKLKNSDAEMVISLHSASERFISLIDSLAGTENVETGDGRDKLDMPSLRKSAGLLLREIKSLWRVALLISTLLYPIDVDRAEVSPDKQIELDKRRNLFKTVETAIMKLGLENVWEMKPLVNGKEIMTILQLKTGGPKVKEWQQKSLEWQLADPSRTSEQCIDWMRESHSELS